MYSTYEAWITSGSVKSIFDRIKIYINKGCKKIKGEPNQA